MRTSSVLSGTQPVIYLYLPLAHGLARVTQIVAIDVGGTLAFWGSDPKRIVDELADVCPTHFPSVPRAFETIHTAVLDDVAEASDMRQAIFRRAVSTGARIGARRRAGQAIGPVGRVRHLLGDRLVLSRVRALFGDRLALGMTGAAPIGREILEFFDTCGVRILEGYGMTRDVCRRDAQRPGPDEARHRWAAAPAHRGRRRRRRRGPYLQAQECGATARFAGRATAP